MSLSLFHFLSHWVLTEIISRHRNPDSGPQSGILCLYIIERWQISEWVSSPHLPTWFLVQFGHSKPSLHQISGYSSKYIVFILSIYLIRNTPTIFLNCKIQSEFLGPRGLPWVPSIPAHPCKKSESPLKPYLSSQIPHPIHRIRLSIRLFMHLSPFFTCLQIIPIN